MYIFEEMVDDLTKDVFPKEKFPDDSKHRRAFHGAVVANPRVKTCGELHRVAKLIAKKTEKQIEKLTFADVF